MRKKNRHLLYTLGVFTFGILIAFSLLHGSMYGKLYSATKTFITATIQKAEAIAFSSEEAVVAETEKEKEVTKKEKETLGLVQSDEPDPKTMPGKNVIADLGEMKIWLYEDGVVVKEFPIISKGRPGTAWETIPGAYSIKTKEENHFSSIGEVYMPFSMQFFGNYFIHGWPYYPGGAEVPKGYSGGCIRMTTADAEEIYKFVKIGTPVFVIGDQEVSRTSLSSYKITHSELIPKVSAQAYLVADLDTGEVISQKNQNALLPTASIIKLLTALTWLDTVNQYRNVTVSATAVATYGDQGDLVAGEVMPASQLLYPLLLESSNDAAEAMAEHAGRAHFLNMMNEKAKALGMRSTFVDEPAGLSPQTVSTANDLMKLAQNIFKYKKFVNSITTLPEYTGAGHTWHNISHFLNRDDFIGGKPGYTDEAGYTNITFHSLPLSEFSKRNIAIILLDGGKPTKDTDTLSMISYISKNVTYVPQELTQR